MATTMELACEERQDLADLVAQLTPQQWEQLSLCERWRVRDVVAHMIGYDELGSAALVRQFVRGRFRFNRINQVGVDDHRARSPEELRQTVADHLQPRGLTAGFGGMIALVDGMIHQQDIRRALGIPRTIPPRRLLAVLDYARYVPAVPRRLARPLGTPGRHGCRLEVTGLVRKFADPVKRF